VRDDVYEIIQSHVNEAAEEYGVPADLINAIIHSESSFDPTKRSARGAVGLMQLLPSTAKAMGIKDSLDPIQNIKGGAKYLRELLDKYKGNQELALAAYHGGPRRVAEVNNALKSGDYGKKGSGYFGELKRPDGKISTELSIGVNLDGKEMEIPTLVPTLSQDEVQSLLSGKFPNEKIIQKAVEHAKQRMSSGKSPYADELGGPDRSKVPIESNDYVRKTMQNFSDQGSSLRRIYSKTQLAPGGVKVREPSESEKKFFQENPDIPGMATQEDNNVTLNPYMTMDDAKRNSVIKNETARAFMRKQGIQPSFTLTKAQQSAFSTINDGKPYGSDQDVRETIVGRIIGGDPSAGVVTQEQQNFANNLKSVVNLPQYNEKTGDSETLEPEKIRELVR
jgi:hypothetical protein